MQVNTDDINEIHGILKNIHYRCQNSNGFTNASIAGSQILQIKQDFDCRYYGFKKLTDFLEAFPERYIVVRKACGFSSVVTYRYCENIGK